MLFTYKVRMIMGNDTCTTVTTTEASTPAEAALLTEMKWTGITVKIVNVELEGDCCWDTVTCSVDDHYCSTCESHLETDGECMNCDFTR